MRLGGSVAVVAYVEVRWDKYVSMGSRNGRKGELLLGFACELLDHELVHQSCNCGGFLILEVLLMLPLEFFGRLLGKLGGNKGLDKGHGWDVRQ